MKYDGVDIHQYPWRELAANALHGRVGNSRSTTDTGPLTWLNGVWDKLPPAEQGQLAEAISFLVRYSRDPEEQYNGLVFLTQHPHPDVWPNLQHLAYAPHFLLDAPASAGEYTMKFWLIRAVASLAEETMWDAAVKVLEREALDENGTVMPALHTLINKDATWWSQHRDEVLQLHPDLRDVIDTIEAQ